MRVARSILRRLGFDIVRFPRDAPPQAPADRRRLEAIRRNSINAVIDVGASIGEFGAKLRASGYRGRIVSFEPLSGSFAELRRRAEDDSMWTVVHAAIGERDGEATINVSGASVSSSLLAMNQAHVDAMPVSRYVGTETIPLKRLDSALPHALPAADGSRYALKLDVQGYERAVLDGAADTLTRTYVLEIELSLAPLYEGSPLYTEMIARLDALGFRLVSWEDVFIDPETRYVLQADGLFVRS